mmetsp:Transcript_29903/g.77193  ORF Transcript_29903/g.77193 Transcript_29903/m.77193 type:complete len:206 (-) Transcript_29903:1955-2572(-)
MSVEKQYPQFADRLCLKIVRFPFSEKKRESIHFLGRKERERSAVGTYPLRSNRIFHLLIGSMQVRKAVWGPGRRGKSRHQHLNRIFPHFVHMPVIFGQKMVCQPRSELLDVEQDILADRSTHQSHPLVFLVLAKALQTKRLPSSIGVVGLKDFFLNFRGITKNKRWVARPVRSERELKDACWSFLWFCFLFLFFFVFFFHRLGSP